MEHKTTASEYLVSEDAIYSWLGVTSGKAQVDSMELVKQLIQMNAAVIKLPEYFHQTIPVEEPAGLVLVPVAEAVTRLVSARKAALALGVKLKIFACTEARGAIAVSRDRDSRDRKYLSGLTTSGGLHGYCGGLDAAISRGLIYTTVADVVGFKSATPNISEARRFAAAIRAACPEKPLAFGYSPKPDGPRWNENDHTAFEIELYSAGFDYYFFSQFGSAVFPHFPSMNRWVMFNDALKMSLVTAEM